MQPLSTAIRRSLFDCEGLTRRFGAVGCSAYAVAVPLVGHVRERLAVLLGAIRQL